MTQGPAVEKTNFRKPSGIGLIEQVLGATTEPADAGRFGGAAELTDVGANVCVQVGAKLRS